ncbi:hypothetical protein [Streptomyces orinoci]|uniref:Gram-positive cocci surface proteins LPxTG domain-containing protein n=1 Tax=Streptomyces orinoci TaxID=67339 RepID=A0ABV3JQX4_STRON|nr:hypothetical protein [Streptomyces orinoci]
MLLALATAAAFLLAPAAPPPAGAQPGCGEPGRSEFPIASRLAGGPAAYEPGEAPHTWQLELRNATGAECRAVHPVAVLADQGRALRPDQIQLDFYDRGTAHWRPVRFERTEEAENVGVLDGTGFPGFTVPAHGAVVVPLRLGFTGQAARGPVTANVTAVQRRGADGAWVGQSGDYTFTVGPPAEQPAPAASRTPERRPGPAADTPTPTPTPGSGSAEEPLPELASTGRGRLLLILAALGFALITGGAALLAGTRRPYCTRRVRRGARG